MKKNKLFIYLFITFLFSWLSWGIASLINNKTIYMIFFVMGGFGPITAAYISVIVTEEKSVRDFNTRVFNWRYDLIWYLVPFLISFGLGFLVVIITSLVDKNLLSQIDLQPWYMFFPIFISMIIGGGIEEPGWRGIALPELEKRFNSFKASLILGIIWSLWHLPLFLLEGTSQSKMNFFIYSIGVIGLTFILTWFYNKTNSILLCIIFHAAINTTLGMGIFSPSNTLLVSIDAVIKLLVGLIILYISSNNFKKEAAENYDL